MLYLSHNRKWLLNVLFTVTFLAVACTPTQERESSISTTTPITSPRTPTLNLNPIPEPTRTHQQTFIEVPPTIVPSSTPLTIVPTSTPLLNTPTQIATVDINIPTHHPTPIGKYGGSLTVPTEVWFESLDPHIEASDGYAAWGPGIAYSRLMRFKTNADISLPSLSTECDLCSRWTMTSPNEFLFEIRKDISWNYPNEQEFQRVTAKDIEYSLRRQSHETSSNSHIIHMINNVEAMSDDELKVQLVWPDSDFFAALANGKTKIISQNTAELSQSNLSSSALVTSGSWTLSNYDGMGVVRMTSRSGIEQAPYLDAIQFNFVPDSDARLAGYSVGLLDLLNLNTTNTNSKKLQARLQNPVPGSGFEIAFNTAQPPLDSKNIRRAIMASIDPNLIINKAWDGLGFFSFGFPWANPAWSPNPDEWQKYFLDPELKVSKINTQNLPLNITVGDFDTSYKATAELISKQITESGFNPIINYVDRRTYANHWHTGDFQILAGPTFPQSTPNGYLLPVLHSEGQWNTTKHKDDALDSLLEKQAVEYDITARTTIIQMINNHLLEHAYRFMPITNIETWTWPNKVINFYPNFSSSEYSHWQQVWLEP